MLPRVLERNDIKWKIRQLLGFCTDGEEAFIGKVLNGQVDVRSPREVPAGLKERAYPVDAGSVVLGQELRYPSCIRSRSSLPLEIIASCREKALRIVCGFRSAVHRRPLYTMSICFLHTRSRCAFFG